MTITTKSVEKTVYIAQDGKEFDKEKDCIRYESELNFKKLVEQNGEIIKRIYDDEIICLTDIYLDVKKIINLSSCTELYIVNINNEVDAEQVIAFCQSKEGKEVDCSHNILKYGERYLICVHTTMTKMFGADNTVYIIPFIEFNEFWLRMATKIVNLYKL